jgi:hypothetical protein
MFEGTRIPAELITKPKNNSERKVRACSNKHQVIKFKLSNNQKEQKALSEFQRNLV